LRTGYLCAEAPGSCWAKWICRILGATTFHWFMLVEPTGEDWITTESIQKGTSLSRLGWRKVRVFKIKGLEVTPKQIYEVHSAYGECPYDYGVYFRTAVWWLLKHYFNKIIPITKDKAFHCEEWVCLLAVELGAKIIEDNEYPTPELLENSPYLEEI
jgi:hypothetical protein